MASEVVKTILAQLGGGQFRAMTGARDFVGGELFVQFRLPQCGKRGARCNWVRVTYEKGLDLYTVEFCYIRGGMTRPKHTRTYEHLYFDQLRDVISGHTGLALSLR